MTLTQGAVPLMRGVKIMVLTAEQQRRTPRDVRGPWVRPKVPSKKAGRTGSRRRWKRMNVPHYLLFYREPEDMLRYNDPVTGAPTVIATPRQKYALEAAIAQRSPEQP